MAVDKVERLLDLIAALLHASRPLTAEELHERIPGYAPDKESFKRALERDKADLREMGIPVRVEPVPGRVPAVDGYRIDPAEYYLPDPGLEPDELAAIHLAASAVRLEGTSPDGGLRKLGVGGPAATASVATLPAAPHLGEVFDAVGEDRRIRFGYRGAARVVDPFRLHHQRGRWYLQGHDHTRDGSRSFRLDRIEGAVTLDGPGTATVRPEPGAPGLELSGWALGEDEPIEARVRVGAAQARLAVERVGPDVPADWDEDGSVVLTVPVRHVDGFRSFVLGLLDDAEVLGPPELRADLVVWLAAVAGDPDPGGTAPGGTAPGGTAAGGTDPGGPGSST